MKESLVKLWKEKIEKIETVKDLKCVVESFGNFIDTINVGGRNALELSWNNLKVSKERMIDRIIKILEGELSKVSTIDDLFGIVNNLSEIGEALSRNLGDNSYTLWNVLDEGVKLSSDIRIKALRKLVFITSYAKNLPYLPTKHHYGDVFGVAYALDYHIYFIIEAFNSVACIVRGISFSDFITKSGEQRIFSFSREEIPFLNCFVGEQKSAGECNKFYRSVEVVIGENITPGNLGSLKDKLEGLKVLYRRWVDIPAINNCCSGQCEGGVNRGTEDFCKAVKSPNFKSCCVGPLDCCKPNSTTFCLKGCPDGKKASIDCASPSAVLDSDNNQCKPLSDAMKTVLDTTYGERQNKMKILCNVMESDKSYKDFCDGPVSFINKITYKDKKVLELNCDCAECEEIVGYLSRDVCKGEVGISAEYRKKAEEHLKTAGLLEEAQKTIEGGLLKNLGSCPFK